MAIDASSSLATGKCLFLTQSQCKLTKLCHNWTIEHMSYHCEPNFNLPDYLQSSNFSPHKFNPQRALFSVRLYPRGEDQSGSGAIQDGMSLYLHLESDKRDSLTVNLKVATLSATGEKANLKELTQDLAPGSKCGWQNYAVRDDLLKVIKDDTFTLSIEVVIHGGVTHMPVTHDFKLQGETIGPSSTQLVEQTAKSFTVTSWKSQSFTQRWSISNFSKIGVNSITPNPSIRSPAFEFPNDSTKQFGLLLYPKGNESSNGNLSVFLELFSLDENDQLNIIFKFSLMKSDQTFLFGGKRALSKNWGFPRFITCTDLLNPANGLLPDDKLTIYLEATILLRIDTISSSNFTEESEQLKQLSVEQVTQDFSDLLKKRILCDVTLVIGEKEFPAHKSILSARSDVFEKMFEHDFEEKKNNRVKIVDMEPSVLEQFLQFVYSGKVNKLEDHADNLLMAAEKYQIASLKSLCEHFLISQLTLDSVLAYLLLADMHNAHKLKQSAIEFISLESASVMTSDEFGKFLKSNPDLAHEIIRAVFANNLHA